MGRITSEPQTEPTKTHFSHEHPLKLITYQRTSNLSSLCSGCKLKTSGTIYSCTVCDYFLHKKCFEMPKKISHPFHKDHSFTLLAEPAYAEGLFNCDACGETGPGFSYHCKPCGIDLHILCAAMPLSVTHGGHMHKLELTFESPYDTKNFCCDICKAPGSNHWLYRCNLCGFDAHLNCARGAPPNVMGIQPPSPQAAATYSRSAPLPQTQSQHQGFGQQYVGPTPHPMHHNFVPNPMMNTATAIGVPARAPIAPSLGVNRQNELILQAIQQMIHNSNTMNQAILGGSTSGIGSGFAGGLGGVGGGDRAFQQVMQLISGLNNGGGIPGLNALGGGGGVDVLQSLLGGGSGLDFLGGGGGLDFLGGVLGGFGF